MPEALAVWMTPTYVVAWLAGTRLGQQIDHAKEESGHGKQAAGHLDRLAQRSLDAAVPSFVLFLSASSATCASGTIDLAYSRLALL